MKETLTTMLALQNELNVLTIGPKWYEERLPWNLAISQEAAELIDHLGYKWWAKQTPNKEAAKVEVVDMMHFSLSYAVRSYPTLTLSGVAEMLLQDIATRIDIYRLGRCFWDPSELTAVELARLITVKAGTGQTCFGTLVLLGERLGMSFDEQAQLYQSKVVLNTFRQRNGYKEGTYHKLWEEGSNDFNGKEDNDVMQEIARKQIDWKNPQAAEELYSALQREYVRVLKEYGETA